MKFPMDPVKILFSLRILFPEKKADHARFIHPEILINSFTIRSLITHIFFENHIEYRKAELYAVCQSAIKIKSCQF